MKMLLPIILLFLLISCSNNVDKKGNHETLHNSSDSTLLDSVAINDDTTASANTIHVGKTTPQEVLAFAHTLIGTPYKYASADPSSGFDCSGFITYVFNHFDIEVPRTSAGFTDIDREVPLAEAKPGDLVLFTGTNNKIRHVGHMGIITEANNNQFKFIHATSGKAYGVTVSALDPYYMGRFMKVIRVFKQNDR